MPFVLENYSFATIPNAFRQCAISLRTIHSTPLRYFLKKLPYPSISCYSAKKVNGIRLYSLARKNITIKREPIDVYVEPTLLSYKFPYITLKIKCSKGTYIREIANKLGNILECGALLEELKRTKVGCFTLDQCIKQGDLFKKKIVLKQL